MTCSTSSGPGGSELMSGCMHPLDIPNARQRVYAPGSVIFSQGDPISRSYLVKSGWMYNAAELANGSRQIVDIFLPGDLIEPMTLDGVSHVSLCAVDYVTAAEFRQDDFVNASLRHRQLLTNELARMRAIRIERIISLGRRDGARRTAHLLLEFAERLLPNSNSRQREYGCPLTQPDLADCLGMTAIHINRTLRELREMKLLLFKAGSVTIFDRHRAADFTDFNPSYLKRSALSARALRSV